MANRNTIVGMFVLSGIILFGIGIFLVGNRNQTFGHHVQFYTEFENLQGISKGSKVSVAGMDAGQVIGIALPNSSSSRFRITLQIDDRLRGLVRNDSVAVIATEGLVGGTFLLIRPGSPNAIAAAPLSTLRSQEPVDLSKVLDDGVGLLKDTDVTIKDADVAIKRTSSGLDGVLDQVKFTVGNVDDLTLGLKQGKGPAGMLLRDPAVADQVRQSIANLRQSTANLTDASSRADSLVSEIQSRQLPLKVDETLDVVKNTVSSIDASAEEIHRTISEAVGPDIDGSSAGLNINESLSNLNAATANMADDTEALKHNLLTRGFFRRRGYYNLANISPDKYLSDRLFVNSENYRVWLSAADMFRREADGVEVITPAGKQLLNAAVAKFGNSIVGTPIVIEGYSDAADASDRLSESRQHAILVRQYLQRHFQLDAAGLGVVSLKNSPLPGSDHNEWSGVCVVVVRQIKLKGHTE